MTREKKVILATAAVGFMSNGGMVISPALASIIEYFSDVPVTLVQMLITVPALMMIPASLVSSYLNRYFPSRKIFECCLIALAIAGIIPFLVQNFIIIFISRIIVGWSIGSMGPLANALIANTFVDSNKDRAIGIYTASESIGGASMVFFSGIIVKLEWKYNFLIYLIAIIELIIVILFCPKDDKVYSSTIESRAMRTSRIINPTILYVWIVFFIYMAFLNTFPPNIALFIEGEGLGTSTICGAASAMFLVSGFICGLVYSKITAIFKNYTFALGVAVTAIGIVIVANSYSAIVVICGAIVAGFGMGITLPTGNLKSAASVSPSQSAMAIALGATSYQLAQFMTTFLVNPIAKVIFGEGVVRGRFEVSATVLCAWAVIIFIITLLNSRLKARTC
ncbi:MAG: MFS transporter [Clostridiaceae bacterium]